MSKALSVGSVGTSAIMRLMQQAIAATPGITARMIYSRDEDRGRAFARETGVPEHCADYEAMLEREDIDVIYIASPNRFHLPQALQALRHKKHVILEKPAAVRRGDAEQLAQAARENGVFFLEAITTLFMPNYLACKQRLPQLGAIRRAEITYGQYSSKYDAYLRGENPNIFNPEMEAGALNDMGIYCIHTAVDLFGPPETVEFQARRGPNGIDLAGELRLGYPGFLCRLRTAKDRNLNSGCRVEGARGWFESSGALNEFPNARAEINGCLEEIQLQQGVQNRMVFELARFRDAILGRDEAFFQAMARQSAAAAAILEAAHTGQTRLAF